MGLINVHAMIRMKLSEEGGRLSGIKSGYRPNHVFDLTLFNTFMGDIVFEKDVVELGVEEYLTVRFIKTDSLMKYLLVGQEWFLYEGKRLVGEAKIISL